MLSFKTHAFLQLQPYKLQEDVVQVFRKEIMIGVILNMLENLKVYSQECSALRQDEEGASEAEQGHGGQTLPGKQSGTTQEEDPGAKLNQPRVAGFCGPLPSPPGISPSA